ncbi:MAG: hypothetical protein R3E58_04580 [Phycisphaerae bacterium]
MIPTVLIAISMLVLYTMAGSSCPNICDEDELENGVRRRQLLRGDTAGG